MIRFHNALNTRNNGNTAKMPKVKLDFARRSFYFLGASIFNSLPLSLRNINSRILFWKALMVFNLVHFLFFIEFNNFLSIGY